MLIHNMIIHHLIESYAEAKGIYDSLPEDEQLLVSPKGRFVDSPYKVFHYVYKLHNKPVGFIDANKYNGKSITDAFIVYAIKNEYRGKGISKILLSKAVIGCKKIGYKRLIYRCDINNIPSYRAALSFGFMLKSKSKTQYVLTYDLDNIVSKEGYIAGYDTFKVHPQTTDYTCGPACVMMVLDYYGMLNGETETSLAKELDTDNYTGTHVSAIEYYFKCKGWIVNSSNIEGSPSKYEDFKLWLDYNLSHNNPIMVENKALDGHWRVIIGFDEDNETLLVADPYTKINDGINVINAHDFFTTWYDTINKSVKAWVTAKPPK